jgi:hypothetical protein
MLVLGLIAFLSLALLLGRCVASIGTDRIMPASGHNLDEIAQLGDETMLLEAGSTGSEIHKWATTGKGVHTFRVEDSIFQPGSAAIAPDGKVRIARFVKLVDANPGLSANIFIGGNGRASEQHFSLLQARAQQVRKELIADGVVARIDAKPPELPNNRDAAVYISLAKRV